MSRDYSKIKEDWKKKCTDVSHILCRLMNRINVLLKNENMNDENNIYNN